MPVHRRFRYLIQPQLQLYPRLMQQNPQLRDAASGEVLAVIDAGMRCLFIHRAPLDRAYEEERDPIEGQGACRYEETAIPVDWTQADFDNRHGLLRLSI